LATKVGYLKRADTVRRAADSIDDAVGKTILNALADAFEQAANRDVDDTSDRQASGHEAPNIRLVQH
jgi:hypothetical protein